MRRLATVLALASALVLVWSGVAPAATTQPVSGSASGTATVTFGVPAGSPPGAFDTQLDTGTYSSSGPLGNGAYRIDVYVFLTATRVTFSGSVTLTRSDGATLSGTATGYAEILPLGETIPFHYDLDLTNGTGGLVSATLAGDGTLTDTLLVPPGSTSRSTFAFTGTVVANTTPPGKDACKDGGWHSFTNANGQPFRNQGQCVSWAVHTTR